MSSCLHAHRRTSRQLISWRGLEQQNSLLRQSPRIQGLQLKRSSAPGGGAWHTARYPAEGQSQLKEVLLDFHLFKRNSIESMFYCLPNFNLIAALYVRNADNFLTAVCTAATVSYRLSVWMLGTAAFVISMSRSN